MDIPYNGCRPCAVNPLEYEDPSEQDVLKLQEDLAKRLNLLGLKTTALIFKCLEEDAVHRERRAADTFATVTTFIDKRLRVELQALYDEWLRFFVDHLPTMMQVQTFEIAEEMEDEYDPETGELLRSRPRKVKNAIGFQVFAELSRLYYLLQRHKLIQEVYESEIVSLSNTRHDSWIGIYNSFDISAQYEEKEEKDEEVEEKLFLMKQLWEKSLAKAKNLFWALMDLEKVYEKALIEQTLSLW